MRWQSSGGLGSQERDRLAEAAIDPAGRPRQPLRTYPLNKLDGLQWFRPRNPMTIYSCCRLKLLSTRVVFGSVECCVCVPTHGQSMALPPKDRQNGCRTWWSWATNRWCGLTPRAATRPGQNFHLGRLPDTTSPGASVTHPNFIHSSMVRAPPTLCAPCGWTNTSNNHCCGVLLGRRLLDDKGLPDHLSVAED